LQISELTMGKIVLILFLTFSLSQSRPSREERQFGWLWGSSEKKQEAKKPAVQQRPSQILQRRTNQFVNEIQGNGIGNFPPKPVINRKYPPPPVGAPKKGFRRPPLPPPKKVQQDQKRTIERRKVLMPVIISSYASTNIQGRGNENKERIKEALEKYEKLNEISDEIPSDDIIQDVDITKKNEGYNDRVKSNVVELSVDAVDPDDILILGEEKEVSESSKVITTTEVVEPNVTSTEQTPTTTSATTTQFEKEESNLEIRTDIPISNEIVEYEEGSPYLPEIPAKLDEEIHGTPSEKPELIVKEDIPKNYLAGYQQVKPLKIGNGNDRTEQQIPGQEAVTRVAEKPNIYPLGKPVVRPSFKKPVQPKPQVETKENSFFDFLPFWKSSGQVKPKRPLPPPPPPRRPLGPKVTKLELEPQPDYPKGLQAPVLLKVDSELPPPGQNQLYPVQETPERPETIEEPSNNARIDNSIHTELENEPQEAFIVLPAKEHKPHSHLPKPVNKPGQTINYPARSNARPPQRINPGQAPARRPPPPPPQRYPKRPQLGRGGSNAPLPMLSQPVIGLPQVPASRKQSPFIAKRPPLPPQLPSSYPGAPQAPPKKFYPQKPPLPRFPPKSPPRPTSAPFAKKPIKKIFKKPEQFPPKTLENQQKIPQPTKSSLVKPIDLKPNGSNKATSDIASHLSSLLNSFFSTTASPAPAPSLPSLVEDTEFADIVNGYKASDEKKKEIGTPLTKESKKPESPTKPEIKVEKSEESFYDELDSLSAPSLDNKFKQNKNKLIFPTSSPKPTTQQASQTSTSTSASSPIPTTTRRASTSTTEQTTFPSTSTTTTTTAAPSNIDDVTEQFVSPIQELVNEYQKKGHVVPQTQYPEPVLKAIQKNFEHKKNIFEQFVSFDESDKAFIPNKEVYGSDWSRVNPVNLSDKLLVYQTFAPSETTPHAPSTLAPQTSTIQFEAAKSNPTFPHERNAEGGFRPMLRPLHSPLLN